MSYPYYKTESGIFSNEQKFYNCPRCLSQKIIVNLFIYEPIIICKDCNWLGNKSELISATIHEKEKIIKIRQRLLKIKKLYEEK